MRYILGLELFLHCFYQYNFNEYGLWNGTDYGQRQFTPMEVAITGFFTLNFMYLKFLIIWRVFRVAGWFDGIDSPENMNRCVNNNYTFAGFWRSWHGSFNKWIIRYMYVPLGGSKKAFLSIWLIFTFIGLWHDLITQWLAWALCNCVFMTAEIFFINFWYSSRFARLHRHWSWRWLVSAAGASNIFLLMIANLAILHGFDGTPVFLRNAFLVPGGQFTAAVTWVFFFMGLFIMQEIRAGEARSQQAKRF
eukprot:TRINITY_DN11494_c0_g1_i1.p2 TRINITY_DN11494_c0_g1~~TRINITY_DN11494_c0_g1_i1.p2  ORF type:complete len:249 (-),score=102.86 TRINITY_DN11494_c0_g1_i1:96-842(-)